MLDGLVAVWIVLGVGLVAYNLALQALDLIS